MLSARSWSARVVICLSLLTLPGMPRQTWAQESTPPQCRFLCSPSLLFEPTMTIENFARSPRITEGNAPPEKELRETIFESIVALDVPTSVPMWAATLVVALAMAAAAAVLIKGGMGRIKRIQPIPERTVESVKENLEWMKQPTK